MTPDDIRKAIYRRRAALAAAREQFAERVRALQSVPPITDSSLKAASASGGGPTDAGASPFDILEQAAGPRVAGTASPPAVQPPAPPETGGDHGALERSAGAKCGPCSIRPHDDPGRRLDIYDTAGVDPRAGQAALVAAACFGALLVLVLARLAWDALR